MGARYVEVRREAMCKALEAAGFKPEVRPGREFHAYEAVYTRRHDVHPEYEIKVYTSISASSGSARGCGEDSIKVVLVEHVTLRGQKGPYVVVQGRGKAKKVLRTGSEQAVIERTLERAREMYALANEYIRTSRR